MSEKESPDSTVYSYHTFVFPFLWNRGGEVTREDFERCIDRAQWSPDRFDDFSIFDGENRINTFRKERYAQFQYFNAPARNAIFMTEDSQRMIVRNYLYKPELLSKEENAGAFLIIKKAEKCYTLRVNGLRLKLYNSGIGLLIYELENTEHRSVEDVNRINEFGRRVFCPYIFDANHLSSTLTADSLSLHGIGYPLSFTEDEWCIMADAYDTSKAPRTKLAKIVTMLLSNGPVSVTTDESEACDHKLYIEPIIDDRMFVACFVQDLSFADQLKDWNKDAGEYRWLSDALEKHPDAKDSIARQLYKFVFVDGGGLTCQNRAMLHSLLAQHVYSRWGEYGTIHGITESSMVCVSSADNDCVAKNPFLTQYIELALLTLAQRASLIAFARQISRVSMDYKKARELMKDYVRFQSQLLLTEVTAQQQGIELYSMMLESFYVNKYKDDVENRVQKLFELKNFKTEKRENRILFAIAVLGGVSIIDIILHWIGWL